MQKEAGPPLDRLRRYHRCCQRNGRWLLATGSDGRTLLTTAVVWRQVEQKAVLIFELLFIRNQNISPEESGGRSESAVPTS